MRYCPSCGVEVGEDDEFCFSCGFRLLKEQYCPKCGSKISNEDNFCPICEATLGVEEPQPQTPAETGVAKEVKSDETQTVVGEERPPDASVEDSQAEKPSHTPETGHSNGGVNWLLILIGLIIAGVIGWAVGHSPYEELNASYEKLNMSYMAVSEELSSIKEQLNNTEKQLSNTKEELSSIKKVYPPKHFSSERELYNWLRDNDVSEKSYPQYAEEGYAMLLEIQEDALKDGYLISANFYTCDEGETYSGYCTTLVDGKLVWWYPDTDELAFFDLDFSGIR